ncbi:MAG TPA: PKD domain-containing protein, partial [Nitrosopumilaceae archaeon]|nr:PKD domain-containing protein [Nitrosopumilaceae archaeon]
MMKITRNVTVAFFACWIVFSACKKEKYPESTNGNPVFYFNGAVNGNNINLQGGINNYYMYSSFTQDINNVYNFIANLKQTSSASSSIEMQINNYTTSVPNGNAQMDSSLTPGYYPYFSGTSIPTRYIVQFNSYYGNGTALTYNWNFGDGETSSLSNPSHVFRHPGYYNVCLTITGTNSCSNSICNAVNVGVPGSYYQVS